LRVVSRPKGVIPFRCPAALRLWSGPIFFSKARLSEAESDQEEDTEAGRSSGLMTCLYELLFTELNPLRGESLDLDTLI
jgi:hypothetical protein